MLGISVPRCVTLAVVAVTCCALSNPSKPARLQPYDGSVLEERLRGYSWQSYQQCMQELLLYAVREAPSRRRHLV